MEIENLGLAWNVVTTYLGPDNEARRSCSPDEFTSALSYLHRHGLSHIIKEYFLASLKDDLHDNIIPGFWDRFENSSVGRYQKFPEALDYIYDHLKTYYLAIDELQILQDNLKSQALPSNTSSNIQYVEPVIKEEVLSTARSLTFAKWPVDFRAVLVDFFEHSFKVYECYRKISKDKGSESFCEIPVDGKCCCKDFVNTFSTSIKKLYELHFFETVIGDVPINVAQDIVKKHIQDVCKGNFETPLLDKLYLWIVTDIVEWFCSIFYEYTDNSKPVDRLEKYKERLVNILHEAYAEVRMKQLFDIIIEFPESQNALLDLKECLALTNLRPKLITTLKTSLETRLLHPGVNTADILTAYISAIKALRVLDHTGVVLQVVSEPVCKYLKSRDDTVRCIISSLREDSCGELACELMKGVPLKLEDNYSNEEEADDWEKWCPDPIDADPTKSTECQRSSDIIGILVNIYGSKELFVNEYRSLLADRILTTFSYNTEREIRYLELLKLRFGESQLHSCEVMLRDIADSKRLNAHLNSTESKNYESGDFPVNTMILSAQFWPSFKEEKIKLPEYIWEHLKKYTKAFESLKGNRTLVWKPHLGNVDLCIELKGRTLNVSVTPVHATILWHFQEKPRWSINELSTEIQLQASVLRRKITFWQSHGILYEEETDVFVLTEDQNTTNQESVVMIEEEEESVTASSQEMKEEELQRFWSFIVGMLTNMDSLPLERIHSMLRMFAVQGTSTNECSIQDMKQFLEKKVRDRQLVYSAGMFKLPKFDS
ncbi:anaphase-promoting complex subunit 2-like [Uloborus diversus]|uniref:anaphase-promoting complex subunit 2-like n=1 Tax=Uloborus diversus TaxID=327109 RepID=UPI00240A2033|nr:anaphase-promoting complex subunit 2-like [Uloborus diversus]XP_054716768.1 anaphase-promoting complex subunit 2-like [Uloborus diversus]